MNNRVWNMLRSKFKPDGKGRFKTLDAMKVADLLAEENEALHKIIDAYAEDEGYIPKRVSDLWNRYHDKWDIEYDTESSNNKKKHI